MEERDEGNDIIVFKNFKSIISNNELSFSTVLLIPIIMEHIVNTQNYVLNHRVKLEHKWNLVEGTTPHLIVLLLLSMKTLD